MPNIADLSDEPKFTIKAVAAQTGIRPVTMRAWERRYEVLSPYRSENRYRLYSERDIAILRWLKNRSDSGVAISTAVAELRKMIAQSQWPEAVPQMPAHLPGKPALPPAQYAARLTQAFMRHDETAAAEVLQEAHEAFDLTTVFEGVIIPCLVEIGEAWYNGIIRVTTEHFASAFLRGKLLALLQAYPTRRSAPFILLGCAPTEQHELGVLMLAVLTRKQGYRVEFLGPDIPIDDLVDYASYEHPALIVLSASSALAALEMKTAQAKLSKIRPAPVFAFGGRAFDLDPKLAAQIPGNYLGNSLEKALARVNELLADR